MTKERICRTTMLAAAVALLAGCTAEKLEETEGEVPICLTATVMEGGGQRPTRAGTDVQTSQLPGGETFYASFSGYNSVNVASGQVSVASATYTADGSGGVTASLQPYFTLAGTSTTVNAYHGKSGGASGTQVTGETTSFSVATDQSQTATGVANYKASDLMYATATVAKSSPTGTLTFAHRMAKIICNVTKGNGIGSITGVKLVGGYRTVNIATPATCTLGTKLSNHNTTSSYVSLFADANNTADVSCAGLLPPQTIGDGSAEDFLVITTDAGDVTFSLTDKALASARSYAFNITVTASLVGTTVAIAGWNDREAHDITVGSSDNAPEGVEAVDLGLPSGTLWANMNVGATAVTDYGTYFAWGETSGNMKTVFDWNTYAWCTTHYNYMTKYSTSSSYWLDDLNSDTPDGVTQLELGDDAAHANWGGDWRMPTKAEMEELANTYNTDANSGTHLWEWQADYNGSGHNGYLITCNANGNSIFLPAAGCPYYTDMYYLGSRGFYWSSSLNEVYPSCAWHLIFYDGRAYVSRSDRICGCTVRPVIPAKQPELGDAYYSDGSWGSNPHASDATVIGVVAWLGSDSDLKCGKPHGLVMALRDVLSTPRWGATSTDEDFLTNTSSIDGCQSNDKNGLTNTTNLLGDGHTHAAASATQNYTPAALSSSGLSTTWFLPSAAQWLAVMGSSGIGGYTGMFVWNGDASSSTGVVTNINNRLTASGVGGTGLTTDYYWSSTEYNSGDAVFVKLSSSNGVRVGYGTKLAPIRVRAFLAF